jgi:UDP-glucuronate 4-epimerase
MRILVTGAAGFIGFHLAGYLCDRGDEVIGIDNLNDYYDVSLKEARLEQLKPLSNFEFIRLDVAEKSAVEALFRDHSFDRVIHLAAQAGVRYSLENPHAYIQSNVVGFMNVLEGCRHQWCGGAEFTVKDKHLVYASSSSVYGLNASMPFSVHDNVDHPISLYAATKKSTELMAHTYSHLYGFPTTGLRFFTVYGPWGRPDMALFKFTKAILNDEPIDVYNEGYMRRDFTYIDDIVEGVVRVTDRIAESNLSWDAAAPDPGSSPAPYRIYNIGNNNPVRLMDFIRAVEAATGKKAKMNLLPMQKGDVEATYADVDDLQKDCGFAPSTPIESGIENFVEWYRRYFVDGGES